MRNSLVKNEEIENRALAFFKSKNCFFWLSYKFCSIFSISQCLAKLFKKNYQTEILIKQLIALVLLNNLLV